MRVDGRKLDQLRNVKIIPHYLSHPTGSCLIEMGKTRVICSAMIEESVPPWLKKEGDGSGWLTAEYAMLPGSSFERIYRERSKIGGRTQEIQRLIGRSLRMALDLKKLGPRSILIDCDVIDADGGTRTASITGAFVALVLALRKLESNIPGLGECLKRAVAAVSVGVVNGCAHLDLCYEEDKAASVDMNIVKVSTGEFIEVQGTAESEPYSQPTLDSLLKIANEGLTALFKVQDSVLRA